MDRQEYIKWIKDEITTVKANLQNKIRKVYTMFHYQNRQMKRLSKLKKSLKYYQDLFDYEYNKSKKIRQIKLAIQRSV